jgi:hypothetical protein
MRWLKTEIMASLTLMMSIVLIYCICISSLNCDARADIFDYLTKNVTSWEPSGYDINGSAPHFITSWNGTRGIGNLGIGNGSLSSLDTGIDAAQVNYGADYFMAADVSAMGDPGSIFIARPVKGLLFEPPNAVPVTIYARLVGLQVPGNIINVAVRQLGYEY